MSKIAGVMTVSCNWKFCQDWSGSCRVCRTCSAGPVSYVISTVPLKLVIVKTVMAGNFKQIIVEAL